MACAVTKGRSLPCKSSVGGLKNVYILDYSPAIAALSDSSGTITLPSDGSAEFFKYEIKGNSSLETSVTSSRENGTTFYTQTLNLTLTYLDAKTQAELQTLAVARPYIVVVDYYGNNFLCGFENGMECTGGTVVTGAAAGDLSGFTLTFEGLEETAPYFLDAAVTPDATQIDPTA